MRVRHHHGTTSHLHALAMPTEGEEPELWVMHPAGPSLAMGSSQKPELFDEHRLAADHVELAPRRSGGGAVFIDPDQTVWIDLLTPRTSPWWSNELAETFLHVGWVWQRVLAGFGVTSEVVTDAPIRTNASALACWAGAGWGEVVVAGAKVVGLSQRRTRWGARVQAMAVLDTSALRVADYLLPVAHERDIDVRAVRAAISVAHAPLLQEAGVVRQQLEDAAIQLFAPGDSGPSSS